MSLFAKNYSLSASTAYRGEEPKSPELSNAPRPALTKQHSTSSISSRNLEVPPSPLGFNKAKSLFLKAKRNDHGGLGIELDSLSSPGMMSPSVPVLGYTASGGAVPHESKDSHTGVSQAKSPLAGDDSKTEYFSIPSRKASKHITIAVDQSALSRARRAIQIQRQSDAGYATYEACMEGARGHEKKSGTYPQGSEKVSFSTYGRVCNTYLCDQAKHHLNRASELFASAIAFKPDQVEALIGKCVYSTVLCWKSETRN